MNFKSVVALLLLLLPFVACTDYVGQIDDQIETLEAEQSSKSSSSSKVPYSSSEKIISSSTKDDVENITESSSSVKMNSSGKNEVSSSSAIVYGILKDDRDGKIYKTIVIGSQTWMAENLNYETDGSFCRNDDNSYCVKYGRLYTWSTATVACPSGWHLPTVEEYETLFSAVGGKSVAAKKLKSRSGWAEGYNGTDDYGFSANPSIYREGYEIVTSDWEYFGYFWTATDDDGESDFAYHLMLYTGDSVEIRFESKSYWYPVRCLKNDSSAGVSPQSSSSEKVMQSSSSYAMSSSSEEVVLSSSSVSSSSIVEESSSSEYVPYDHKDVFFLDSLLSGAYKEFVDPRNNRLYYYLTINGKDEEGKSASVTVMAENLDIGDTVDGNKDQSNDSKIERYCYDNDLTNCDKYGGLYQWAEAMQLPSECNTRSCADLIKPNHQGICPDGWRLMTHSDYYIVTHADGCNRGVEDTRSQKFDGDNCSGFSLVGAGENWNYAFNSLHEFEYWFYPEEESSVSARSNSLSKGSRSDDYSSTSKTHGYSVRCVMIE